MSLAIEDAFRCPTCRAAQEPSETCRRCKCDLQLVGEVMIAYRRHRASCLTALSESRFTTALAHARDCVRLDACAEALKLWAICALLAGDWPTALAASRHAADSE